MNFDKYYEARDIVTDIIKKDLLGPVIEDEIITSYPIMYYVTGKLYPQNCQEEIESTLINDDDITEEEQSFSLTNSMLPSSMGITFSVSTNASTIYVSAKAALYNLNGGKEETASQSLWQRHEIKLDKSELSIGLLDKEKKIEYYLDDGLVLVVFLHKIYNDGVRTITTTLLNKYEKNARTTRPWINEHTYFQPEIRVSGSKSSFVDIRKRIKYNSNKESLEMEMLYSNNNNFVTGHGCSADYILENNTITLYTSFIPSFELKQMMPSINIDSNLMSMKYLSNSGKETLIKELKDWNKQYKNWINNLNQEKDNLQEEYQEVANSNISKCVDVYKSIEASIDCISDNNVYLAFKYANESMLLQRKHTLQAKGILPNESEIRWYPFQLAFILKEIVSFAKPHCPQRKMVDLLWFPTGGGKTEAYLGIAAFVIFLRRLRNPRCGSGVSVIMRYTLRLLTFQQFERASAMICACELLRKKYNIPGTEISIGLWAGKALTPNTIEMAKKILDGFPDPNNESSNPRQLEKCPWCGTPLEPENYICSKRDKRMHIRCNNPKCEFNTGLPVYLIDEEIYDSCPTFLIATVDKFAQVALNEQTFSLFGKGTPNTPPELIIQDELHLISGPLGTITGIYEAAFQRMFTSNGIHAKVIASTATIRNAKEQINSLYGEDFTQFPPQGLNADDSYFAIKSTVKEKPSRMYMGCMGIGMSATLTSALCSSTNQTETNG